MADNTRRKDNLIIILILVNIAVAAAFLMTGGAGPGQHTEALRDAGNKLRAVGLNKEATDLYTAYLNNETLDTGEKAKISFSLAKMYIDDSDYNEAIKWLYIAESLGGGFVDKAELDRKIVLCLEKLGKSTAASYALQTRSKLDESGNEAEIASEIVATVGDTTITLSEVDNAMGRLPAWVKQNYQGVEGKKDFVKKFAAEELIFMKGMKLNYDQDDELKDQIRDFVKGYVIKQVIDKEIKDKIVIEEDDLKNFFIANKAKFDQPETAKISVLKTDNKKDAEKAYKKLKAGAKFAEIVKEFSIDDYMKDRGGVIDMPVGKGTGGVPGVGPSQFANQSIFALDTGGFTEIIEGGDYFFIIKLRERVPAKEADFNELKERVRSEYANEKFAIEYQKMIEDMEKVTDMKFFLDNIK